MEFRQLEAFTAVAELKSFSGAADYLCLSQSTVSTHIIIWFWQLLPPAITLPCRNKTRIL